jgi:hypothetical protein
MANTASIQTEIETDWVPLAELCRLWNRTRYASMRIALAAKVRTQTYPGHRTLFSRSDAERVQVGI